eukprot:2889808-Karenia_brevis.AAC.1
MFGAELVGGKTKKEEAALEASKGIDATKDSKDPGGIEEGEEPFRKEEGKSADAEETQGSKG